LRKHLIDYRTPAGGFQPARLAGKDDSPAPTGMAASAAFTGFDRAADDEERFMLTLFLQAW
jgi:hypothetical protein